MDKIKQKEKEINNHKNSQDKTMLSEALYEVQFRHRRWMFKGDWGKHKGLNIHCPQVSYTG